SNDKFDALQDSGHVTCPKCNSSTVTKELMAPPVRASRKAKKAEVPQPMATGPDPEVADAIKAIRDHVEKNSDYVGDDFAKQARAMHDGDKPQRSIHGQANVEDAKKLIEDGVPAVPLPFIPRQKTN
ncbi:DUF1178 family protein, partial [Rhodobacteraceae bacterium]|nr:DUF1178 family protein [Paracoccaceae bacterium]